MACNCSTPNVNKTFIIEQVDETPVFSACTSIFTDMVKSCSGDATMTMGTGLVTFNSNVDGIDSLTANTVEATTYLSGGTNILNIVNGNDTYITSAELTGTTLDLNRNDSVKVSVDLNPIVSGKTDLTLFSAYTSTTETILNNKIENGLNFGGANEVFSAKSGTDLYFRTITGGSNTNVIVDGDVIKINSSGSSSDKFGSIYFVSSDGDDSVAEKGNILKPWANIASARDQAILDADTSPLIYVYPGVYGGSNFQYNGAYFFTPGVTLTSVTQYHGTSGLVSINQGSKTFTTPGNFDYHFIPGKKILIIDSSSGNNGLYTVVSASNNGSNTDVVVQEPIPSPTVSGRLTDVQPIFQFGDSGEPLLDGVVTNKCRVYGELIADIAKTIDDDWSGGFVNSYENADSYIEVHSITVEKGIGLFQVSNSKLTLKGEFFDITDEGYAMTFRDSSESVLNFQKINISSNAAYGVFVRNGVVSGFNGKLLIEAEEIVRSGSGDLLVFNSVIDGAKVWIESPNINHSGSGKAIFNVFAGSGGEIKINGNISATKAIDCFGNSGGILKITGDLISNGSTTNFINHPNGGLYVNGDIYQDSNLNDVTNMVNQTGGDLRLNGKITNLTSGGCAINKSGGNLYLDSVTLETLNNFTINATNSQVVNINNSLKINKELNPNITTNGLFNFTGTTNVSDLVITNEPDNDDSLTQILGRNSSNGNIEYRDVDSITSSINTAFTAHTGNTDNPHSTSFSNLISTAHTHTISNIIDLQSELNSKTDNISFTAHTGDTSNPHSTSFSNLISTAHTHTISNITNLQTELNNKVDNLAFTTHTGDTAIHYTKNSINLSELGNTAHTHSIVEITNLQTELNSKTDNTSFTTHTGDTTIHYTKGSINLSDLGNTAHTHNISEITNLQSELNNKTNNTAFTAHTGDTTIHYTKNSINLSDLGNTAHTHNISEITNLQSELNSKTDNISFTAHTGNTDNPHSTSFSNLTSTAHTHNISEITNLQSELNNIISSGSANSVTQELIFTNTTGGTFSVTNAAALFTDNDINVTGGVYNTSTGCVTFSTNSGSTFDVCGFVTGITDTFVTGGTLSGTNLDLSRSNGTNASSIDLSSLISGKADDIAFTTHTGDTTIHYTKNSINLSELGNTAHTHNISEINNLSVNLDNKFDKSGGTINGDLTVTGDTVINGKLTVDNQIFFKGSPITFGNSTADSIDFTGRINGDFIPVWDNNSSIGKPITSTPQKYWKNLYVHNITGGTLNLFSGLTTNNSGTEILVRNSSTGQIEKRDISSITGSTNTVWTVGSGGTFSIKADNNSTTESTGNYSVASGFNTLASGVASNAEGANTKAIADYSHSEGLSTTASGSNSHAEGSGTFAMGTNSHSEGEGSMASGESSHAEGLATTASGSASHSEGDGTTASGSASHSEGLGTTSSGNNSHAGGKNSKSVGDTSFIHSDGSIVTGNRSVVLGGQNITGATDDTVYVPKLNINSVGSTTPTENLGVDVDGNVVSVDLNPLFTGKTDNIVFTAHTGDTTIHYTKGSINLSELGNTAHTHNISEIIDLQTELNSKFDKSGGTINGHLIVEPSDSGYTSGTTFYLTEDSFNLRVASQEDPSYSKVKIGLFSGYTNTADTSFTTFFTSKESGSKVVLGSEINGDTIIKGDNSIEMTTNDFTLTSGLGGVVNIGYYGFPSMFPSSTINIGNDANNTDLNILVNTVNITGDTVIDGNLKVTGDTVLENSVTAKTINITSHPTLNNSATDILVRNSGTGDIEYRPVSGITPDTNTFITGGTFSSETLTLGRNDGNSVIVTGFTSGSGEINTASNLGSGTGLFFQKSGVDLEFKSITSTGGTVTITNDSTTINVEAAGGNSGVSDANKIFSWFMTV